MHFPMRLTCLFIAAALLAGCASSTHPVMSNGNDKPSSAALVFDPPVAMYDRPLDLSRNNRGEAAYAGFEDTTTTYFYIHTDDRQTTDLSDRFVREGYSDKVGSVHR
jgi:hypothetical protein